MQGYRTVIFNSILAIVALVRIIFPDTVLPSDEELTKILEAIWAAIVIIGNVGLRFVTKGPVGVKNPSCE